MAGFDGYPTGDPRNEETALILNLFRQAIGGDPLVCLTQLPTRFVKVFILSLAIVFECQVTF